MENEVEVAEGIVYLVVAFLFVCTRIMLVFYVRFRGRELDDFDVREGSFEGVEGFRVVSGEVDGFDVGVVD